MAELLGSADAQGEFEGAGWDRYSLGDVHVRVGLVEGGDQVKTLTLFRDVGGDFRIFLDALGRPEGDPGILPAVGLIDRDFEVERDDLDGDDWLYHLFETGGADFLFENGVLDSIFLYLEPETLHPEALEPTYAPYRPAGALFDGLDAGFTDDDLTRLLGQPEATGEDGDRLWRRYAVDGKFVHVEVSASGGPVQGLTFMASTP